MQVAARFVTSVVLNLIGAKVRSPLTKSSAVIRSQKKGIANDRQKVDRPSRSCKARLKMHEPSRASLRNRSCAAHLCPGHFADGSKALASAYLDSTCDGATGNVDAADESWWADCRARKPLV